jgi:hypothetical protein
MENQTTSASPGAAKDLEKADLDTVYKTGSSGKFVGW